MAKVVVLPKTPQSHDETPAAPPDEGARLRARRAELMAEAAKLNKVAQAREAAERALAELNAEQARLDEAEQEAWRLWAQNDAQAPPPTPRVQERAQIDQRRALLGRDLTGALNGQNAIAPRLQALHAELHEVGLALYARRIDALMSEANELNAEVHAAARAFVAVAERADGLRDSVVAELERAVNSNDRDREATLRTAFSQIERLEPPRLAGDANERARHAADYRRRLA